MAFDWREFLIVAHELRNDAREGVQRCCLGRAYYYIYNLVLIKARTLKFDATPPGLHAKLWTWCQKHSEANIKSIGIEGARMLALRHDADYRDAQIPNLAGEVKRQLSRAQKIEALVARSDGQPPPPPLK